jgi:hypothetical protein
MTLAARNLQLAASMHAPAEHEGHRASVQRCEEPTAYGATGLCSRTLLHALNTLRHCSSTFRRIHTPCLQPNTHTHPACVPVCLQRAASAAPQAAHRQPAAPGASTNTEAFLDEASQRCSQRVTLRSASTGSHSPPRPTCVWYTHISYGTQRNTRYSISQRLQHHTGLHTRAQAAPPGANSPHGQNNVATASRQLASRHKTELDPKEAMPKKVQCHIG